MIVEGLYIAKEYDQLKIIDTKNVTSLPILDAKGTIHDLTDCTQV